MSKTTMIRGWAESVVSAPVGSREEAEVLAAEHILTTTAPPTMADIEWDDDKHYLAGATTPDDTDCVMIWSDLDLSGDIVCDDSAWRPDQLTPNGKHYKLVEVTGDEHPETLTTWEDFFNAPEGTVVSSPGAVPAMKNRDGRWRAVGITTPLTSGSLALGAESPATVLRWGWGE